MIENVQALITDFFKVVQIAKCELNPSDISHEFRQAPHVPSVLPNGKQAVYVFSLQIPIPMVLKVGKVGPNSNARFVFHHYNPNSSISNLAKSLLGDEMIWRELGESRPDERHIGDWIKRNIDRENFYLDGKTDKLVLSLLELFLQCRLKPRYEG